MKKFRIKKEKVVVGDIHENLYYSHEFFVQMKILWFWIDIKSFLDEDEEYAENCANELLDELKKRI